MSVPIYDDPRDPRQFARDLVDARWSVAIFAQLAATPEFEAAADGATTDGITRIRARLATVGRCVDLALSHLADNVAVADLIHRSQQLRAGIDLPVQDLADAALTPNVDDLKERLGVLHRQADRLPAIDAVAHHVLQNLETASGVCPPTDSDSELATIAGKIAGQRSEESLLRQVMAARVHAMNVRRFVGSNFDAVLQVGGDHAVSLLGSTAAIVDVADRAIRQLGGQVPKDADPAPVVDPVAAEHSMGQLSARLFSRLTERAVEALGSESSVVMTLRGADVHEPHLGKAQAAMRRMSRYVAEHQSGPSGAVA